MSSELIDKKINIMLIEKTNSHFEWLFTHDRFLESAGFNRFIAVDVSQINRVQNSTAVVSGFDFQATSFLKQLKMIFKLRNYILSKKIEIVIFNTAHNTFVRNLLILLPKNVLRLGILHRGQYVISSRTQKLITNYIDGYFCLSNYQAENIQKHIDKSIHVMYNLTFRVKDKNDTFENNNYFDIVIPGNVEEHRRDNIYFIQQIEKIKPGKNIRFVFLGKCNRDTEDGKLFLKAASNSNYRNNILIYDDFVPDELFDVMMRNAKLLLPLIHHDMPNFENYLKYQISGTFNLSYAYRIPMLIEESFSIYEEFRLSSLFYTKYELAAKISSIFDNPQMLDRLKTNIESYPVWQIEYQRKNYIDFIKENCKKKSLQRSDFEQD